MKAKFNYPTEFVTLPEYTKRAGSIVDIVRPLSAQEAEPPCEEDGIEQMYLIRADDGWEGHAFDSELERIAE